MAFAAFVVPWEKVDQAIVAIHSFKLKNPTWRCRVYSDDVLALRRLEAAFADTLEYVQIHRADPVAVLSTLLEHSTEDRVCLVSSHSVCNRPIAEVSHADLSGQDVVVRPDRPFELSSMNDLYVRFDPHHPDRLVRSKSYFTLGLAVFNLARLRSNPDWADLDARYLAQDNPDRGHYKHFINRLAAPLKKGLLPGNFVIKPEVSVVDRLTYSMCLRHHVRLREAAVANFAGPIYPWTPNLTTDRVFLQIPFRRYLNRAFEVKSHLSDPFYQAVKKTPDAGTIGMVTWMKPSSMPLT